MTRVKSIMLSIICGAVLGASIVCSAAFAQSPTPVSQGQERGQTSITLLSRVVDFFRECSVAVGTMSGRSQQPRPDRFQDLLQRQTRSFFLPQGRWSG